MLCLGCGLAAFGIYDCILVIVMCCLLFWLHCCHACLDDLDFFGVVLGFVLCFLFVALCDVCMLVMIRSLHCCDYYFVYCGLGVILVWLRG